MVHYNYQVLIYFKKKNDRYISLISRLNAGIWKWLSYLRELVKKYVSYPRNAGDMVFNINQLTHNHKLNDAIKLIPREDKTNKNVTNTLYYWTSEEPFLV